MTSNPARYAYLNTRVSILAEQLMRSEQREQLFSRNLDQIEGLLRETGLDKVGNELPHNADQLEQSLTSLLMMEAHLLSRGLGGAEKQLIVHWMRRFELINLKILIRAKLSNLPAQQIIGNLVDLTPLTGIPLDELINTENINEFLWRLESTAYGAMAQQARRVYEEKQSLFAVEAVMDSRYFSDLARKALNLRGEDQKYTRLIIGSLLDQINLVWLLRFRIDFHLDPPQAYFLLSGGGHELGRAKLLELVQLDTLEQFVTNLPAHMRSKLEGFTSISQIESQMMRETRKVAHHVLRNTSFNVARAFAYLYLREQQAQLIHIAMKGKLLNLDDELICSCGFPRKAKLAAGADNTSPAWSLH